MVDWTNVAHPAMERMQAFQPASLPSTLVEIASKEYLVIYPLMVGSLRYLPKSLVVYVQFSTDLVFDNFTRIFGEVYHEFMQTDLLARGKVKSFKAPFNNVSLFF